MPTHAEAVTSTAGCTSSEPIVPAANHQANSHVLRMFGSTRLALSS